MRCLGSYTVPQRRLTWWLAPLGVCPVCGAWVVVRGDVVSAHEWADTDAAWMDGPSLQIPAREVIP